MLEEIFDKMSDKECIEVAKGFIQMDIENAKDNEAGCENCLIMQILDSYDKPLLDGIMIGLSIACGFTDKEDSDAKHWLRHAAKLSQDAKILDSEILENKDAV